jgi:hypothetical protein
MSKGQKRSGREPKKPKQNKPKGGAAPSPFAAPAKSGASAGGKKK